MTKPGRNDPCPCGSGKKYKHCCGGIDAKVIPFPGNEEGGYRRMFRPLMQRSFVVNLHLLGKLARSWTARAALAKAYLRAFPPSARTSGESPKLWASASWRARSASV